MTKKCLLLACAVTLLLLSYSPLLHAQAVGTITGIVTDPSGALVPGAKVTATRVETGISQSTVTTSAGTYTIPNLVVGTYTVLAEAHGFKSGTAEGITLDVAQQRVVNFKLVVAGVTALVEVNAAPPLLNTTTSDLGGVVSAQQVQNLPLNGRDITGLVYLQPGVVGNTGSMGWMDGQGQWISNGNRGETMTGTLDDGDISDAEMGTLQFTNFNLDAIAEFKVEQNNYSAQYGQGAGSITEMVSKSGTNQFHGSLFEFVRNSAFDARNFFATSVPPFRRNEFGTTFGGPIKRDKTFFFLEYAGLRQRLGEPDIVPVPTAAEQTGAVTIADPVTGNPDNLQVPLTPVAAEVLSKFPLPNQPNGELGPNTLNFMFSQPTNDDQFSARVDHHFSAKDSLFVRASYVNNIAKETDPWAAYQAGANFSTSTIGEARNYTISETHLFSPTLLNEFTFTLNRGLEGVPEAPAESTTTDTNFLDGSLASFGPDSFETKYVNTVFGYKDNVAWTKGRHSFNIGGSFRREWDNGFGVTSVGPSGSYDFNSGTPLPVAIPSTNGGTSLPAGYASPSGMISMMEGADQSYNRSVAAAGYGPPGGFVWWGLRRSMLAAYLQDDFKATRRLTFNLGLRYEYDSVPWEVGDRLSLPAERGDLYGHFVINPQPLWPADRLSGDFGPRFGLALDLGHSTVVRGGLGIFTNMIPTVYPDQSLVDFPVAATTSLSNATYSLTPLPYSLPLLTSTSGQTLVANGNTKSVPANTAINYAAYVPLVGQMIGDFPSDSMRNGYTINGNFTLEHQFAGGVEAQASYVSNDGVSLYTQDYPNAMAGAEPQYAPFTQITPGLSELQSFHNGAHSSYNGLQAQVQKNSSAHGIVFQANYTYAKDMTDADAVWSSGGQNGAIMENDPQCRKCEYAPASYSIAQRFVANFQYSVPFDRAFSQLPKRLTQGWKALGIFQAQSGNPFTVVTSYGSLQYGFDTYDGIGVRPFLLQRATRSSSLVTGCGPQFFSDAVIGFDSTTCAGPGGSSPLDGVGTGYFNIPLVTSPITGNAAQTGPGNLGRNTYVGPGWANLDFSVIKDTKITESKSLQFRAEFFNILNLATFGGPGATLGSTGFGLITGTATSERQIQFGLRFIF